MTGGGFGTVVAGGGFYCCAAVFGMANYGHIETAADEKAANQHAQADAANCAFEFHFRHLHVFGHSRALIHRPANSNIFINSGVYPRLYTNVL